MNNNSFDSLNKNQKTLVYAQIEASADYWARGLDATIHNELEQELNRNFSFCVAGQAGESYDEAVKVNRDKALGHIGLFAEVLLNHIARWREPIESHSTFFVDAPRPMNMPMRW